VLRELLMNARSLPTDQGGGDEMMK
jgi:hypothetical protein